MNTFVLAHITALKVVRKYKLNNFSRGCKNTCAFEADTRSLTPAAIFIRKFTNQFVAINWHGGLGGPGYQQGTE